MDQHEASAPLAQEKPKKKKRHFFLLVLLVAFALILLGQLLGDLLMGLLLRLIPNPDAGLQFLLQYLSFIGIIILMLAYCALLEKELFRSYLWPKGGGMRGNTAKNFALGLLIGFLMNGACILVAWLHGDLHFSVGRFPALYLLCALLCVCVQSGAEELVTRGYILGALRERYAAWAAIALNSLFFGLLHLLNPGITVFSLLSIVLVGFALSLIVYALDSLWMAIAIHAAWNFTQNFLFGLPNSGIVSARSFLHLEAAADSPFYDAAFGVEGTVTAVAVELLLALAVLLYARKTRKSKAQAA